MAVDAACAWPHPAAARSELAVTVNCQLLAPFFCFEPNAAAKRERFQAASSNSHGPAHPPPLVHGQSPFFLYSLEEVIPSNDKLYLVFEYLDRDLKQYMEQIYPQKVDRMLAKVEMPFLNGTGMVPLIGL